MQSELERIFKSRTEQLKSIFTKEDKQKQPQNNFYSDSLDSSQAKANYYKEEFVKQLKLADVNILSPI